MQLVLSLQNIFLGEDIRKQLPHESAMFDNINNRWKEITKRMYKTKIVLHCCSHKGQFTALCLGVRASCVCACMYTSHTGVCVCV